MTSNSRPPPRERPGITICPGTRQAGDGDLDEAIRSYQAALRLQPNHYNSLFFLADRFDTDKINRRPEAIAYFTACIALRPDHFMPTSSWNAASPLELGHLDAAKADFEAALALAKDDVDRWKAMDGLGDGVLARREYSKAEALMLRRWSPAAASRGRSYPARSYGRTTWPCCLDQGNFGQAGRSTVTALDVSRRVLGQEHPDTLGFMRNLA